MVQAVTTQRTESSKREEQRVRGCSLGTAIGEMQQKQLHDIDGECCMLSIARCCTALTAAMVLTSHVLLLKPAIPNCGSCWAHDYFMLTAASSLQHAHLSMIRPLIPLASHLVELEQTCPADNLELHSQLTTCQSFGMWTQARSCLPSSTGIDCSLPGAAVLQLDLHQR